MPQVNERQINEKLALLVAGTWVAGWRKHCKAQVYCPLCYDANDSIRQTVKANGCEVSTSAQALSANVQLLILSLPKAEIVESVMDSIHSTLRPNTIVVDTSTSKPATSQKLSAQAQSGSYFFLDAPVSGGPVAANSGTMTMLIGGDSQALDTATPILEVLTSRIVRVGASGAGHAAKIANNMLCAANLVLVSEAIKLAAACGVDAEDLLEGVNAGSGRSGVSEVNFPRWIVNNAFDSGFTMGLMRKDVRLALELAQQNEIQLEGFSSIAELWARSEEILPDTEDFNKISTLNG